MIHRAVAAALIAGGVSAGGTAIAQSGSGAYLAARIAQKHHDFSVAAQYYARALGMDAGNAQLMEKTAASYLATGRVDRALPVARHMEMQGLNSQIAHMVSLAGLVDAGQWEAVLARDPETQGVGPLVDGLVRAWALMGAGSVADALAAFDEVGKTDGLLSFALYHKAMALAMVGDFETAEAIFADPERGAAMMTRRGAMARAEILSQLDRNADAVAMLDRAFSGNVDPGLELMASRLSAGETMPFTHVRSAADGVAEVFFSVAAALNSEASDDYTLIYARVAQFLRPDHTDAQLLSAQLLDDLGQYDLAVQAYMNVPDDSPDHHAAALGRADALRRSGRPAEAITVLEQLAQDYPGLKVVHASLGDLLRSQKNFAEAELAYNRAIQLAGEGARSLWFLHYARGISRERTGNWPGAEADFRAALEIRPDQPQVLNYLGYTLVEKRTKLDEALDMIERAAEARPNSGYIADSLGWVLFQLGRYEEAVGHMERAVELMPVDPTVNDHLGDVYYAVGREREAEFQWRRAMSFMDTDAAAADDAATLERIRRKLEVGLHVVLAEEEAERKTVELVNDGG